MTNLVATPGWDDVFQLETNTLVLGGENGPSNLQAQALLNRTQLIKDKLRDIYSVTDAGAKGDGTDDITAVLLARQNSPNLHFPLRNGVNTTYTLGAFSPGQLAGSVISADTGVTISFASNEYNLYQSIVFDTDVNVVFRDISVKYQFPKTEPLSHKDALRQITPPLARHRTALDARNPVTVSPRSILWPNSDEFFAAGISASSQSSLSFSSSVEQAFTGGFVELGPYETVSAFFDSGVSPGPIGIIIRGTGGFGVVYKGSGTGNYFTAVKPTGDAIIGNSANLAWPDLGQGRYESYAAEKSVWSVTRIKSDQVIIKLNGRSLSAPFTADVGYIFEVGFVCFTNQSFTISGFTIERRVDAILGRKNLQEIRVFGDSTAASFPGDWVGLLRPTLDTAFGIKLEKVSNFAIAGTTLAQSIARYDQVGPGDAYYVILCSGTNSIQSQTPINDFRSQVNAFIDRVSSDGRIPILLVPPIYYTRNQSGGVGQNSSNYDLGAPYRMVMERVAYERGVVLVKMQEEIPNADPKYLLSDPDSALLRDNIHQDVIGYQCYAKVVAQALVDDYLSLPSSMEQMPPRAWMLNGTTNPLQDLRISIDKDGVSNFAGTLAVTTISNETELLHLPRWGRPKHSINIIAQALTADGVSILGTCYLNYSPATGNLKIIHAPVGTVLLVFQSNSYATLT